jgi:hypothetical protein
MLVFMLLMFQRHTNSLGSFGCRGSCRATRPVRPASLSADERPCGVDALFHSLLSPFYSWRILMDFIPNDVVTQTEPTTEAFFHAWKRCVEIAGYEWFGDGSYDGFACAVCKEELSPNVLKLSQALSLSFSSGRRLFIAAMVSLFNAQIGDSLFRRVGYQGLSDLGKLDLNQRRALADAMVYYTGW